MFKRFGVTEKTVVSMSIMILLGLGLSLINSGGINVYHLVLVVVGVGLIYWLMAAQRAELMELVPAAQALATGNFSVMCSATGDDSRSMIARALN